MGNWGVPSPPITRISGPVIDDRIESLLGNQIRFKEALGALDDANALRLRVLQEYLGDELFALRVQADEQAATSSRLLGELRAAAAHFHAESLLTIRRAEDALDRRVQSEIAGLEAHLWEFFWASARAWLVDLLARSWRRVWRRH